MLVLKIPWLRVRISAGQGFKRKAVYTEGAGPVCKCTDNVHWKGVYRVGDRDLGVQNFFFGF